MRFSIEIDCRLVTFSVCSAVHLRVFIQENIMTTIKSSRIRMGLATFLAAMLLPLLSGHGDTVTLKDGSKLEGKITYEADDFIKIELSRSGSIKETKLLNRSDIQTIAKTQPDVQDLEKIKQNLPTRSLMTSSDYQDLITTGPEAFLKAHPDSLLSGEVKKILEELKAEKAKIDRGAIKLEGEWISPEKQQNFPTLVKSQIRLFTMKQKAAEHNHTGALRDFQVIEEQFVGTPAYPEAIKISLAILPTYGQLLTRQLKDVEFLNNKREADIKLLPPESQARTQAAYEKEQERFKALADQEKNSGIKWRSVNRRNKESIAPMIDTVRQELDRLGKIDTGKLAEQAAQLVKVDELINENKLEEARELLSAAGGNVSAGSRKRSSRSKGSTTKSSYSADLAKKIDFKIKSAEEAAKNATTSAKAKEVAAAITQTAAKMADDKKEAEGKEGEKKDKGSADDALEAVMAARQKAAEVESQKAEKKTPAKPSKDAEKKPKAKSSDKKRSPSSSGGGGGISFQAIVMIFAAIMVVVVVVMKKMGIGGGKGGGGDGGE